MKKLNSIILVIAILGTLLLSSCQFINKDHTCPDCGRCTLTDCTEDGHTKKCNCENYVPGSGELPTYGDLEGHPGFHISIFGDPAQQTVEAYQQLKDLGCNWVYLDPWNGTNINTPGLIKALEVCEQVGLNALIMINNAADATPETAVSFLDVATVDYTQYPAFKGVYAGDEPDLEMAKWHAADLERWENSQYKDYIYLVNTCVRLTDNLPSNEWVQLYWDNFLSKSDDNYLVFDKYPLYAKIGDKVLPYLRENWLSHLDAYSNLAKEQDCKYITYIQTYTEKDGSARDMVSVRDARFQVAMSLAYGSQGFACFTYINMSQFGPSMVTGNGQKLDKYYYVQQAFNEIRSFEDVYFAFDWQGVMPVLGPNRGTDRGYGEQPEEHITTLVHTLDEIDRIDNVKTDYDLFIGAFEDKDGNDGFLITSYTDPYYLKNNNIEIDFNSASRALIYYNGYLLTNDEAGSCYNLDDGVLKFNLEAGDYIFVIPVK